jgi:hypothetical protein
VNARLGFHLTDWLSIGGMIGQNLTPTFETSFHQELVSRLPDTKVPTDRAPIKDEARAGMNHIGQVFAVQAEIVPFSGKFALFSKLFLNYDSYVFAGPGFINFKAETTCPSGAMQPICAVSGMKIGANFGAGIHAFVNDFFAINLEIRDIFVRHNPAGIDADNHDGIADKNDYAWDSNYLLTMNLMFFLPSKASISN